MHRLSRTSVMPIIAALSILSPISATTTFTDLDGDNLLDINELDNFNALKALQEIKIKNTALQDTTGINQLQNATSIEIHDSQIASLDNDDFYDLNKLQVFRLSNSNITSLKSGSSLFSLSNLYSLVIDSSNITTIEANTFDGLATLSYLNLYGNKINRTYAHSFQGLSNLSYLSLVDNQLSENTFAVDTLYPLASLFFLELGNNNFTTINADYFQGLTNLTSIDFSVNKLSIFDLNSFIFTPNLKYLDLAYNDISSIKHLSATSSINTFDNLKFLSLVANKLTSIDASFFQNMKNIEDVHLAFNYDLTTIAEDTFKDLKKIKTITLTNCNKLNLIDGTFNNLTTLEELDLSDTNTTHITTNTFKNLPNLETLRLGSNNIQSIESGAFKDLTAIKYLSFMDANLDILDLTDASLRNLEEFREPDQIHTAILTRLDIDQDSFDVLMLGAGSYADLNHPTNTGLADAANLTTLILNQINFADITDLSSLTSNALQDNLTTLSMQYITNLDESLLLSLIDANNLAALNTLNLTGSWSALSTDTQNQLMSWDAVATNTLIIPEPAAASLFLLLSLTALSYRSRSN
ncbi:Leucine Rich repeats (2 copies) [Poriferisphaera corsica]|uniref:Leucine Rich repeats (2 copies) n=1 Tax=Poriferisphaera corsica TaxID=2528020 RepID=A0A517YVZ4_9BACT|nr:leucine-rich repeat domain-containing protein [Poriferisphaera corsica]QDU34382.1 Leucine Rich repeats (2 copies) [Poriferisphaera corsica]